ncbi:MAG TPA: sulfatase/phosphatase domain-containing protein, partial [Symbiobacteriaceae bacterium]|nr:sulfatase/phosphatase domain-containing protein [Symbiobacteriaceae bacterium]
NGYQGWNGPFYSFAEVALSMHHNAPKGHYGEWIRQHFPDVEEKFWQIEGRRPPSGPPMTWASEVPVAAHTSTWVGDITIDYLRRQAGSSEPFFAWVGFPDPHHPFCPPKELADMYDPAEVPLPPRRSGDLKDRPPQYRAWYEDGVRHEGAGGKFVPAELSEQQLREMTAYNYAQVSLVDRNIGRILDELDRLGLASNTIVVFTADHGELLGEHGLLLKGPFMCEGLLRVPLIVRWPGTPAAPGAAGALVSLADLMPTLLEAAGAPAPGAVAGRSFLPVLNGTSTQHRDAVLTEFHSAYFPGLNIRTLRTPKYKLSYYAGKPYGELYDLWQDPGEFENRWNDPAYAEVKADLIRRLLDEVLALDSGFPGPLSHA